MDLAPSLMEWHGATPPAHAHGRSLQPAMEGGAALHEGVLYGYFGKDVNLTDGRYTYCRQPTQGSTVYHHTAMPRGFSDFVSRRELAAAETGLFLPSTHGIPHFRIARTSFRHADATEGHPLHDLQDDPGQQQPLHDPELEARMEVLLRRELERCGAPACQFERLGL
jgi:hypothetical protein